MKPIIIILASLFIFSQITRAQMKNIEFQEFTMDNGLHVILHQDKTAPLVVVSVMYHVGSKNERADRNGFAHFFEHLLFEGSENIERGQFDKYVLNNGGTLNANTWYDRTYYYVMMPSNQLELGMWLESERMLHAKVDQKGIDTQRSVVKEERSQTVDNRPYGSLLEETMKRAFSKHPYRWSVIGNMDHLDAAGEEDYKSFYEEYYVPNNAILTIAGNIEFEETKKMAYKYFGNIPRGGEPSRPDIVEPPLEGEIRDTIYDNIQLPAVVQAYRIPAQGTADYYSVYLLSKILSQGESSRLNRSIVDDKQLALQVVNFPLFLEDPGVAINFALANIGVPLETLEEAIDEEVIDLQNNLISETEFQKLLNQVENDVVNQSSTVAGVAERLANYKMYFGDTDLINTEIERFKSVTREDIRRVAGKYFNKKNRVVLYYLPKSAQQ